MGYARDIHFGDPMALIRKCLNCKRPKCNNCVQNIPKTDMRRYERAAELERRKT